jgi:hypothetical protein
MGGNFGEELKILLLFPEIPLPLPKCNSNVLGLKKQWQ